MRRWLWLGMAILTFVSCGAADSRALYTPPDTLAVPQPRERTGSIWAKRISRSYVRPSTTTSSAPATSTTKPKPKPVQQPAPTQPASPVTPTVSGNSQGRVLIGEFYMTCYQLTGTTASGKKAGPGSIAVDPRVIRLGTLLYVDDYGDGDARDTGGDIKGHRIDVWKSSCYRFHNGTVKVYRR